MLSVWYWPPNAISEALEFATDIRMSRTAETRDSYKDATQRLMYSYTVEQDVASSMIETYRSQPLTAFLVPEWPVALISDVATLAVAQTVIDVPDVAVYQVGGQVFIGNGNAAWEQAEVASIASGQITLTTGLTNAYDGSVRKLFVAPLCPCILPSGLSFETQYAVTTISANFLSLQPIDIGVNPYPVYEGLPLVTDGMISFSPLTGNVSQESVLAESGFGAYQLIETEEYIRRYGQLSFYDTEYDTRMERRKFHHFMRGRDGEMWMRSGQRDLVLRNPFGASSLTLSIQPITAASQMVGKHIYVTDGVNSAASEITDASDVSTTQQDISISALGFSGDQNAAVSILHRCRFDADTVNMAYRFIPSGMDCNSVLSIVEVP